MNTRNLVISVGILTASFVMGQGPIYDKVEVNLPYAITVNNKVLPPGNYVIREHESPAGASRIVHFYDNQGMKLETTAMAIPALDKRTPEETKLILDHIGSCYYLNKIWVQGKDYGYEFPIPESVKLREKERSASVAVVGQYQAAPAPVVTEQTTTTEVKREQADQPTQSAQVAPAPEPAQAPEPAPAPRTMPETASNWLNLVFGGALLTGSGFAVRRVAGAVARR